MKNAFLKYSEPRTKEQITTNLVYLLRENEKMKYINLLDLDTTKNFGLYSDLKWTFLKEAFPKMNEHFRELWKELQLKDNLKEIKRLEGMLKKML